VKQRYIPAADSITFVSTLKPRMARTPIAKNKTYFTITPSHTGGGSHVHASARNTCYIPPPLNALAKECMNQSTDETVACLRQACGDPL
jgi:hypothetical protein